MPSPSTDRDTLLGLLAVRMDLITEQALATATTEWERDRSRSLGQVLVSRGLLREKELVHLEGLLVSHREPQGISQAGRTLFTLGMAPGQLEPPREAGRSEARLGEPDPALQQTLMPTGDPTAPEAPAGVPALRYRIVRLHARGGLGEVFVALDAELGREVALKEIQARHAHDTESRKRFLLEAEVTGRLEHPGIVPVYGLGAYADGRPYYAMRFIKGDSLQHALQRFHADAALKANPGKRTLELRQLLGRFIAVCNAIAYAHSKDILHRDLKPANVMLGEYGETLVVDWGLAKAVGAGEKAGSGSATLRLSGASSDSGITQAGSVLGTPAYMSPEQAAGQIEDLGPASDTYALGATLYHLLTGKAPFGGSDLHELLERVRCGQFPPPRTVAPSVPAALEAICLKAMALRPRDRYATAKDLSEDIEHWLADEPVVAYREPLRLRLARWRRRHPALVTGTAALAFTALVAVGVGSLLLSREQGRTLQEQKAKLAEQDKRALAQVNALLNASPQTVPPILEGLAPFRAQVQPRLREVLDQPKPMGRTENDLRLWQQHRTRAALALLPGDSGQRNFLKERLLDEDVEPEEMLLLRDHLLPHKKELAEELWGKIGKGAKKDGVRFRALVALAAFDPESPRWTTVGKDVVGPLLAAEPLYVGVWSKGLLPVKDALMTPLTEVFRDRKHPTEGRMAASVLRDYTADRPEMLADLLMDADTRQFPLLLAKLRTSGGRAVALLHEELDRKPTPDWRDRPLDPKWSVPARELAQEIEKAQGLVAERFALCQALPLARWQAVAEALRPSGYRPVRFRPYVAGATVLVAALWTRDGRVWQAAQGLTAEQVKDQDGQWRGKGYVPVDVAGWLSGVRQVYGLLCVKGGARGEEGRLYGGVPSTDHKAAFREWQTRSFVPSTLHAFVGPDGKARYSGVWVKSFEAGVANWNANEATYREQLADLSWIPVDVSLYRMAQGNCHYASVRHVSTTRTAAESHGLSVADHMRRCRALAAQGYRPVALAVVQMPDGKPVAASAWHRPVVSESQRDHLAQRQANAAVALLALKQSDRVWPLFKQSAYPDARTHLLHRAGWLGADVQELWRRLAKEEDASTRQALVLALGEYAEEQLPTDRRKQWTERLLGWYRSDPDSGVHASIDWLLRHGKDGPQPRKCDWGGAKELQKMDEALKGKPAESGRRWHVNGQGQTMVLFPGPVEFLMGSPNGEAGHCTDEMLRRRRIGRSFALASKKVTVAQFQRFKKAHPEVKHSYTKEYSPDDDGPIIGVTWYEAAQYCRWLSEQEGIPEDQMSYPSVAAIEKCKDGVTPLKLPANYLARTGYRLPTEAEWEFACRAGTQTSRSSGSAEEMLGYHAWYLRNSEGRAWPVGQKKPNGFGLFDVQGNIWDWCQEAHSRFKVGGRGEPVNDEEDRRDITDKFILVLRGGAFNNHPRLVRSANRRSYRPSNRGDDVGLRVARTYR